MKVPVGKMFARHIKVPEQEKYLKETVSHVLVGTPNRMATLLEREAYTTDEVLGENLSFLVLRLLSTSTITI